MPPLLFLAMWIVLGGCSSKATIPIAEFGAPAPAARAADGVVASNMLRDDYAGVAECTQCHGKRAAHFATSPMRTMTRVGTTPTLSTPFDGRVFSFKGETARLYEKGGERFVELDAERTGQVVYRVTKAIGGRYREDFAGVAVSGEVPETPAGTEWILPFSYMIETDTLRYKGYSVPIVERPGLHVSGQWNATCAFCHNTAPRFLRAWGDVVERAPGYQANFVDRTLPRDLRWVHTVTDPRRFEEALVAELGYLGETSVPRREAPASQLDAGLVTHGIEVLRDNLREDHLVDLGIGCEACHLGSAQHVEDPRNVRPTFEPRSDFMTFGPRDGHTPTEAEWINRTCAQCHSVIFSRYPYTWEGGLRKRNPGGSVSNSGEARDFMLGACSTQMSCVDCHDPHAADAPEALAAMRTAAGNGVCTTCHGDYADVETLAAHTHHAPTGEGSACLNCHMPQKNIGLNTNLTAYHRIGSPNDPERVLGDRPLECALCHADSSVDELVTTMEAWWGGSFDRAKLGRLYGTTRGSIVETTLRIGKPHEQLVALHLLESSSIADRERHAAALLTHEIPLVRYHALGVLRALTGEDVAIDLHVERAQIEEQVDAWLRPR